MSTAYYRKHNDGSKNSSTYHKKDGTPVRARLKREMTVLTAINTLEDACLSADSKRATKEDLEDNGCQSTYAYYIWLKRQTNARVPAWADLTNKPRH